MQDPDPPPQEEVDTSGAEDGVRQNVARAVPWAALARSSRAFSPLPWITATAPIWARIAVMATVDHGDLAFLLLIPWSIPSLCPLPARILRRAFSLSSKTCSSGARFRPPARR